MALDECAAGVGGMRAGDKRGEVLEWRGAMLINDCYNSNPAALNAMVDALMAIPAERHVVVAGEMLELGPEAEALHAACGVRMADCGVEFVLGVRGAAEAMVEAAKTRRAEALFVASPEEAGEWLVANLRRGDVVLFKASRGVCLEKALAVIADGTR
jgi:UDP-N-acetylmuramoyl-tripeptide--D-alanyl-D-alanine ligase